MNIRIGMAVLWLGAGGAQGAILLGETGQQGSYSIADDAGTPGIEIKCDVRWYNASTAVPANNQIEANGDFGTDGSGLVEITTTDMIHQILPPTYTITADSFVIDYADGVFNPANQDDTFIFHFNLGTTNLSTAQAVVDELNAAVSGALDWIDSLYVQPGSINGKTVGGAVPDDFENSPVVQIPWRTGVVLDAYGVPPGWYRMHGTAAEEDPDADGYTSWQEYICGTDPTNGLDHLAFTLATNTLAFTTAPDRLYEVIASPNLVSNLWRPRSKPHQPRRLLPPRSRTAVTVFHHKGHRGFIFLFLCVL